MATQRDTGDAGRLNDPYGLHPIALVTIRRVLLTEGTAEAIRCGTYDDFRHAGNLLFLLDSGETERACAEIGRLLDDFPEERGLGPCGWCGSHAAPRRFAYDVADVRKAAGDPRGLPGGAARPGRAPPRYAVDLTCADCGCCTGTFDGYSLSLATAGARSRWERQRERGIAVASSARRGRPLELAAAGFGALAASRVFVRAVRCRPGRHGG